MGSLSLERDVPFLLPFRCAIMINWGQGTWTSPQGERYVGELQHGKKHGKVTQGWVHNDVPSSEACAASIVDLIVESRFS